MINQKRDIDYQPFSRPKKYFILETQFRSGIKGATFTDIYRLPKRKGFVPWVGLTIMFVSFAITYITLDFGWLNWIPKLFR